MLVLAVQGHERLLRSVSRGFMPVTPMTIEKNATRITEYDDVCKQQGPTYCMWRTPDSSIEEDAYGMFCAPLCNGDFDVIADGTGNGVEYSCRRVVRTKKKVTRRVVRGNAKYLLVATRQPSHVTILPS